MNDLYLTFDEHRHTYTVDGQPQPSVTEVMKVEAAPALEQWKINQVAQYAVEHQAAWTLLPRDDAYRLLQSSVYWQSRRAADKGTEAHQEVFAEDPDSPYASAAVQFITDIGLTVTTNDREVQIWDESGYAGTADVLTQTTVIDWKRKPTRDKILYPNQGVQIVAYGNAGHRAAKTGELLTYSPEKGIVADNHPAPEGLLYPKPQQVHGWMVALYPDATYRAWHVDLLDPAWTLRWESLWGLYQSLNPTKTAWKEYTP